jgi:hypothetical protein
MSFIPEPDEEKRYAKFKRPYEFGSIGLTPDGFVMSPARVESQFPNCFRQAVYPDGERAIQGAYAWSQGSEGGVIWKDLPLVYVDENGQEIK